MEKARIDRATLLFSGMYMAFCILGINHTMRQKGMALSVPYYVMIGLVGWFTIYAFLLTMVKLLQHSKKVHHCCVLSPQKYIVLAFVIIWVSCFVIYLNMYPGTLSCDTPGQLREAVTLQDFENYNPLINTLVLTFFVQIGMQIQSVNLGVAFYTLFQFTLYALAAAYTLGVLIRVKDSIYVRVAGLIFFLFPINLIYATGMWKDTFFAVILLFNMAFILSMIENGKELDRKQKITLFISTLLSSLARNSGWSAIVVEALVLLFYAKKDMKDMNNKKKLYRTIARTQLIGVLAALCIIRFGYSAFQVESMASSTGISVPMQQLARVVADNEATDVEKNMINRLGRYENIVESIPEEYSPSLVDPVRGLFAPEKVNTKEFWTTYLEIGMNHPKEYFLAFIDHTINYWWPASSSWLTDNRIFDNEFGVERTSKLFPEKDIAMGLYRIARYIKPLKLLSNSGFTLWMILLCMYLCQKSHNKIGQVLCIPYLVIYIGLIIFSYASLFRYTYAAVLGMPLLWGYLQLGQHDENENNQVEKCKEA